MKHQQVIECIKMVAHRLLLILLFFVLATTMFGQQNTSEIDKIKVSFSKYLNGFHPVYNGVSHRNYQGKVVKGDIDGLLERDVIEYYRLEGKYDSPLKLKMFKQGQEYKNLLARLETERKYLLADTFYIISKIDKTNYDLREKAFFFEERINSIIYTTTYFVDFYGLGIVTPLLNKNKGVKVEIEDERIALDVENNYQDCRLVYIFTYDEKLSNQNEEFPIGKLQKLLLVNIKSGKVYYYQVNKPDLVQYDHDIYAEMKSMDGFEYPVKFFLKVGGKMVELDEEEFEDDYILEIVDDKYYVVGVDGKKYLLTFKPERVIHDEKEAAYFEKCEEIAKDFKLYPEKYEDVTVVTDNVVHSYTDKSGFDWVYETEGLYYYVLEEEGVYMIFDELKFIRKKESDKIYTGIVEEAPEYPGGNAKLMEFLAKNIHYPMSAMENGIQGQVIVKFVVDKDGSIVDPKVVRSVDPACDKEALRVIKSMPKWKPGKQDGKPVRVEFTMPVNFKLS